MDSKQIGAWLKKKEHIPIFVFAALALLGLILYLKFDTPYHVITSWIRSYQTHSITAPDKSTYEYALQHVTGATIGYFSAIVLLVIGIIGTVVSAVLVFLIKKNGNQIGNCYCDMVKHVLLLVFTFGIYYLIWIYRITGYLNQVKDEPSRKQTSELLLCMFIPFYAIFWVYKSAQRLDKLAVSNGVSSDITTICLILAIFVGVVPPIIMQDKINAIVNTESKN
jgi:hypothetical protein